MTCNDGKLIEQRMQPCEQLDCERKAEPAPWQHAFLAENETISLEGFYHSDCFDAERDIMGENLWEAHHGM